MLIDPLITAEIIEEFEIYTDQIRPLLDIREKLDIAYMIDNQSNIIYEIRPGWDNPEEYFTSDIAKQHM